MYLHLLIDIKDQNLHVSFMLLLFLRYIMDLAKQIGIESVLQARLSIHWKRSYGLSSIRIHMRNQLLTAINLVGDTDTIAALVGGLAGVYYGFQRIPDIWIQNILKKKEIANLVSAYFRFVTA